MSRSDTPLLPATALAAHLCDAVHCVSAECLLNALPSDTVDLIVTSPPYDNLRTYNGFAWNFEYIARQSYRVLKPGGVLVWIVGDATINGSETLTSMRQALYFVDTVGFRMHDTMIWDKNTLTFPDTNRYYQIWEFMFVLSKEKPKTANLLTRPNRWAGSSSDKRRRLNKTDLEFNSKAKGRVVKQEGVVANLWKINTGYGKTTSDLIAYDHPAMFPEALAERHILTWSIPGDLVLDYFGGSGTTAKMARANGRHYLTCDISAEYVALMNKRLSMPYTLPLFDTPAHDSAAS